MKLFASRKTLSNALLDPNFEPSSAYCFGEITTSREISWIVAESTQIFPLIFTYEPYLLEIFFVPNANSQKAVPVDPLEAL